MSPYFIYWLSYYFFWCKTISQLKLPGTAGLPDWLTFCFSSRPGYAGDCFLTSISEHLHHCDHSLWTRRSMNSGSHSLAHLRSHPKLSMTNMTQFCIILQVDLSPSSFSPQCLWTHLDLPISTAVWALSSERLFLLNCHQPALPT